MCKTVYISFPMCSHFTVQTIDCGLPTKKGWMKKLFATKQNSCKLEFVKHKSDGLCPKCVSIRANAKAPTPPPQPTRSSPRSSPPNSVKADPHAKRRATELALVPNEQRDKLVANLARMARDHEAERQANLLAIEESKRFYGEGSRSRNTARNKRDSYIPADAVTGFMMQPGYALDKPPIPSALNDHLEGSKPERSPSPPDHSPSLPAVHVQPLQRSTARAGAWARRGRGPLRIVTERSNTFPTRHPIAHDPDGRISPIWSPLSQRASCDVSPILSPTIYAPIPQSPPVDHEKMVRDLEEAERLWRSSTR